jgi:DNA-binding response OmpR family regulator
VTIRVLDSGADHYVVKPVSLEMLSERLHTPSCGAVRRHRAPLIDADGRVGYPGAFDRALDGVFRAGALLARDRRCADRRVVLPGRASCAGINAAESPWCRSARA